MVGYSVNTNSATWTDGGYPDGDYLDGVKWVSSKGEVMSSSPFSSSTCPTYDKTTAQLQSSGYIDSTANLVAAHDAATAHLGASWRMPKYADFDDLISKCDTIRETCNGVWGWRVTGRGVYSSKSIFLPAAGYGDSYGYLGDFGSVGNYWSSSYNLYYSKSALVLDFASSYFRGNLFRRDLGISVRPVRDSAQ